MSKEGTLWGTPLKHVLFGSDGRNSISSGSDVPEGRSGWPPDGEYPEVGQSRRSPQDDCFEGTRSPKVKLVDAVLQLQKDFGSHFGQYIYIQTAMLGTREYTWSSPFRANAHNYSFNMEYTLIIMSFMHYIST